MFDVIMNNIQESITLGGIIIGLSGLFGKYLSSRLIEGYKTKSLKEIDELKCNYQIELRSLDERFQLNLLKVESQLQISKSTYELLFDNKTAMLHYADNVESARIIKVVAITEGVNKLFIKAAKINSEGKIVPLSEDERYNFTGYIDAIKFAGVETDVISTTEDKIKYDMQIYYDPAIPVTIVRDNIHKSLDAFKTAIGFDSMLYLQKMLDVVMAVPGVITINLNSISRKGATDATFIDFNVFSELASGYFDYDGDCNLVLTSIKDLR